MKLDSRLFNFALVPATVLAIGGCTVGDANNGTTSDSTSTTVAPTATPLTLTVPTATPLTLTTPESQRLPGPGTSPSFNADDRSFGTDGPDTTDPFASGMTTETEFNDDFELDDGLDDNLDFDAGESFDDGTTSGTTFGPYDTPGTFTPSLDDGSLPDTTSPSPSPEPQNGF